MQTTTPSLVLLTSEFPYGSAAETFLEAEIDVLADRFDRVYVLPSHQAEGRRPVPPNVELVEMDWLKGSSRFARRRALASGDALSVLHSTVRFSIDTTPYRRMPRRYAQILAGNLLKRRSLEQLVRERGLEHAVFYDYWFENSTLALALLRRSGTIHTAVSRAHGFDLYDERWDGGCVPFREAKAWWLDAVFAVSTFGLRYLERRLPGLRKRLGVARLGVRDPGRSSPERDSGPPLVVTCGALQPFKCVHLVPEVLERLDRPVRWIHLGDGPERPRVLSAASRLPSRVTWELRGQVDNREVLRLYERQHVDACLSLSTTEGLPVSMMEAQSYGIPVVARGVGGIPEIVREDTGVLLAPEANPADAAAGLRAALEPGRFGAAAIRGFFHEHFDAVVNYNRFADSLYALSERRAGAA
jgi:glycosyltransferase involved in cell wall biosynthesis